MDGYKLVFYIFIISLFQIFTNSLFDYLKDKTNTKKANTYILNSTNFTINAICFLYNIYFILTFFRIFLLPELIDIFFATKDVLY